MALGEKQSLIKSRKRVRDHGEVFTPDWLVRDMCDLVGEACAQVGSRFLEPACGDGNFLVEILRRKLAAARRVAGGRADTARFRRVAFEALTSLYGIDILPDNVAACRANLLALWEGAHGRQVRERSPWAACRAAARFVLERNILVGDTLRPEGTESLAPIVLTEWQWRGDAVGRTEVALSELLDSDEEALPLAGPLQNTFPPVPYTALAAPPPAAPPAFRRAVEWLGPDYVQACFVFPEEPT